MASYLYFQTASGAFKRKQGSDPQSEGHSKRQCLGSLRLATADTDDDAEGILPALKRRRLASLQLTRAALNDTDEVQSDPKHPMLTTQDWDESSTPKSLAPSVSLKTTGPEDESVSPMAPQLKRLAIGETKFHQFALLPSELRLMIWRQTWECRNVTPQRNITGYSDPQDGSIVLNDDYAENSGIHSDVDYMVALRKKQQRSMQSHWMDGGSQNVAHFTSRYLVTKTHCLKSDAPVTLRINRESRYETLRHYQIALKLPGGASTVYFNFDLDVLNFSHHGPLSLAFSKPDMSRIRKLCIPELAPMLPMFAAKVNDEFDSPFPSGFLKRLGEPAEPVYFDEFKDVWKLLRRWFPALREITLSTFQECHRRELCRNLDLDEPMGMTLRPYYDDDSDLDYYCHSCFNIAHTIETRLPEIGIFNNPAQIDLAQVLDYHNIHRPAYIRRTVAIGKVPAGRYPEKDEDVVVHYWEIREKEKDDSLRPWDLKAKEVKWDSVHRRCIARTLEHAFGPARRWDLPVFVSEPPSDQGIQPSVDDGDDSYSADDSDGDSDGDIKELCSRFKGGLR
ncbi:hypothetical protein F4780DRAFT_495379 [Xylariomycetidae sp. FL0641]|nr:hypothetical protein F4780DRAFT_495379 [Xylariomycetidae sp. FL0641]